MLIMPNIKTLTHAIFTFATFGWTPIGSIHSLPKISKTIIDNKEYVIWQKKDKTFVVQDNTCRHRFAPLSEGTVSEDLLECPYHGWKYNSEGVCIHIPQEIHSNCVKYQVNNYETATTSDILWACLDPKHKNISHAVNDKILSNCEIPYIREVPYSWNFLLENFFDPAHIPFAHADLQSVKSDGIPIKMNLHNFDQKCVSVEFKDQVRGVPRTGRMTYISPFTYKLFKKIGEDWADDLTILCVPVTAGRSRVFVCNEKKGILSAKERAESHRMSSAFFNTDDYLVHKQEINSRKTPQRYATPTESDFGVITVNKWIDTYFSKWKYNTARVPELTKIEATDNYERHAKFCKDCANP